jgi:hypothetical protein
MAVISALGSGDFLTIDNLFIITVCLVMALMFIVPSLFHLYSQGKLPVPFLKRPLAPAVAPSSEATRYMPARSTTPPLLDAKGRAVPPDVKAIMNRIGQTEAKDA